MIKNLLSCVRIVLTGYKFDGEFTLMMFSPHNTP